MALIRLWTAVLAAAFAAAGWANSLEPDKAAAVHISVVAEPALAGIASSDTARRERFEAALEAYKREDWTAAITGFRALAAEVPGAAYNVAAMQLQGLPEGDATAPAIAALEQLAAGGFVPAQTLLGNFYMDGIFVERSYDSARRWLARAGVANPRALLTVGEMLEFGLGGAQDLHGAQAIYRELAARADVAEVAQMAGRYADRVARKLGGGRPTRMDT
jgi:TPR repeat protein